MTDKEKVIKGLEVCTSLLYRCADCPYYANCCLDGQAVMEDALALLEEQEKRINELEEKLRLLEYGDQDILESGLRPAT